MQTYIYIYIPTTPLILHTLKYGLTFYPPTHQAEPPVCSLSNPRPHQPCSPPHPVFANPMHIHVNLTSHGYTRSLPTYPSGAPSWSTAPAAFRMTYWNSPTRHKYPNSTVECQTREVYALYLYNILRTERLRSSAGMYIAIQSLHDSQKRFVEQVIPMDLGPDC